MPEKHEKKACSIGFLLFPGFGLMSYTAAIEPLRLANQTTDEELFRWKIFSPDGNNLVSIQKVEMLVDAGIDTVPEDIEYLFVVAGPNAYTIKDRKVFRWLNNVASRNIAIGGISSGAYILANAGLLDGYRCTIHWDDMPAFVEAFPAVETSYSLFEFDRNRITSSGATSAMDMMLRLIGDRHPGDLASRIAIYFQHDRVRTSDDQQRVAEHQALARKSPKLARAAELMAGNSEYLLKPTDLAKQVGLSQRQLERLFNTYCECTPQQYYMRVRVQRARTLLLETGMSVLEVATATGFSTQSHFTKCFRDHYNTTPQKFRVGN